MNENLYMATLALIAFFIVAGLGVYWRELWQLFCRHGEPKYCGEIHVKDIDRGSHRIIYANKMVCPKCRKLLRLDWL